MPELHKLTPTLAALQDRGQRVALLTDGRMSGASGKVLAAIHVTPEAADGGAIAKLREGDLIRIDAEAGSMDVLVDAAEWQARAAALPDLSGNQSGHGPRAVRADAQRRRLGGRRRLRAVRERPMSRANLALVGDIGGTNARFALVDLDAPKIELRESQIAAATRDFASLQHAIEHYLAGVADKPARAALAVACPVGSDEIRLTNRAWSFSRSELQRTLGFSELRMLNDFGAVAWAIPALSPRTPGHPARRTGAAAARPGQRARPRHRAGRRDAGGVRSERLARGGNRGRPRRLRPDRRRGARDLGAG